MSSAPNPDAPADFSEPSFRKTTVRPIQLLQRSFELISGEYWLFLGITWVGIVVSSLVPFSILLGSMMVGFFLCFAQRQQTGRTEFGNLFKGFEQFVDALVAALIMVAVSLAVLIPLIVALLVVVAVIVFQAGPNGGNALLLLFVPIVLISLLIIIASVLIYVPFMFAFQLIADRKVSAGVAVKANARAAWNNLGGVLWFIIAIGFISFLAALPCYIPAILLMPLNVGAMWLLYQDVFGTIENATIVGN